MCLITTNPSPVILEEDLVVYKLLTYTLMSPYQFFQYKKDKLYTTALEESDDRAPLDSIEDEALKELPEEEYDKRVAIGSGFHAALNPKRMRSCLSHGEFIFKCIYPKGSRVIYGFTDLVVSNQIIILEPVYN